jgi:subtilisin family serine protease
MKQNPHRRIKRLIEVFARAFCLPALATFTFTAEGFAASPNYREGHLLVTPRSMAKASEVEKFKAQRKHKVKKKISGANGLQLVELQAGEDVLTAVQSYKGSGLFEIAEPDYRIQLSNTPNDPSFTSGSLWYLQNGQSGIDISAVKAWNTQRDAAGIVVAVIDSGIRKSHQDLAGNLWINPGEIAGNGVDDDQNGVIDDVIGINTIHNTGNVHDDHGHGTHVAGTIGAKGNNGIGTVGVAWNVQIMTCKFMDSTGNGYTSDGIEAVTYARRKGAKVINCSWGSTSYSYSLYNAISQARTAGIIVVCAAGNEVTDNDLTPLYPASYKLPNVISVAATTRQDELSSFSNFGKTTVHLAAPGSGIYSTSYTGDSDYRSMSGTSMATPQVAGALALLAARFPGESVERLVSRVLTTVDPVPALLGRTITGGRLNIYKALGADLPIGAPPPKQAVLAAPRLVTPTSLRLAVNGTAGQSVSVQESADLVNWTTISTIVVGPDGTGQFTTAFNPAAVRKFYRIQPTP